MRSVLDKSPNERSGVISEVKGFLELYLDPVIAANTALSDFGITDLMNHQLPVSLYIVVPLAHKNSLKPVIRLMLAKILHRLTEHLEFRDGRAVTGYLHRLLLMIDEFPGLGRLDVFAESLSLVAGYGIKACSSSRTSVRFTRHTAMTKRSTPIVTPALRLRQSALKQRGCSRK